MANYIDPDSHYPSYYQVSQFLKSKTRYRPEIGIICGSGLSGLSKTLHNTETFNYEDIPGFPQATVPGHAGELVFGLIGSIECVCMRGRFHFYEGNTMDKVVLPVRVMRLMGVKLLIVTNAAGGLNPNFNVGDIMIIQDHFGLVSKSVVSFSLFVYQFSISNLYLFLLHLIQPAIIGNSPLIGPNDDGLGPRFPPLSDAYDKKLQDMVLSAAERLGIKDRMRPNGTYCFLSGPTYETPAECRFLRNQGGDSVGMSTVPEIIAAKHCGMKILGLSLITNMVIATSSEHAIPASHQEVLDAVEVSGKYVQNIVSDIARKEVLGEYLNGLPRFTYDPTSYLNRATPKVKNEVEGEREEAGVAGAGKGGKGCCAAKKSSSCCPFSSCCAKNGGSCCCSAHGHLHVAILVGAAAAAAYWFYHHKKN
jgi:purine-nucleoside phosphorylase